MPKLGLLCIVITASFVWSLQASADSSSIADKRPPLRPFLTDGCTAAPEGTPTAPFSFEPCCKQHDLAYWRGGSFEQKQSADLQLLSCLKEKIDPLTAEIYYEAVRWGGGPDLPTPWHWGYGWLAHRDFSTFSVDDQRWLQAYEPTEAPANYPVVFTETRVIDILWKEKILSVQNFVSQSANQPRSLLTYMVQEWPLGDHWFITSDSCPKGYFRVDEVESGLQLTAYGACRNH